MRPTWQEHPPPKPDNDTSNDASELNQLRSDLAEAMQKLEQAESRSTTLAAAAKRHAYLANRGELRSTDVPHGCPSHEWTYQRLFLAQREIDGGHTARTGGSGCRAGAGPVGARSQYSLVRRIHLITHIRSQRQAGELQERVRRLKRQMQMTMTLDFMYLHDRELGVVVTCHRGIDVYHCIRQGVRRTRTCKIRYCELDSGKTRSEETAPATPRTRPSAMRRSLSREKLNRPTPWSIGAVHEEARKNSSTAPV